MIIQSSVIETDCQKFEEGARLYLTKPKEHPKTYLHPQCFNFSGEATQVLGSSKSIRHMLYEGNALLPTILPTPEGFELDTFNLDQFWSFVLVIDSSVSGMYQEENMTHKQILSGYCLGAPFAPPGDSVEDKPIGPSTALMVTRYAKFITGKQVNMPGHYRRPTINDDVIPQHMAMMCSPDVHLVDIGSVSRLESAYIVNTQGSSHNRILCDPRIQLCNLSMAIDSVLCDLERSVESDMYWDITREWGDHHEHARTMIDKHVALCCRPSSYSQTSFPTQVTRPIFVKEAIESCPDLVHVVVGSPKVDEIVGSDMSEISLRNTMSSLVSSVVASVATECMLSNIVFTYSSTYQDKLTSDVSGEWCVEHHVSILTRDSEVHPEDVERFKSLLSSSLLPILKHVGGDFVLEVSYSMVGLTLVNLNYLDDFDSADVYCEYDNRLGGYASPMIGNRQVFDCNVDQYCALVANIYNDRVGV